MGMQCHIEWLARAFLKRLTFELNDRRELAM